MFDVSSLNSNSYSAIFNITNDHHSGLEPCLYGKNKYKNTAIENYLPNLTEAIYNAAMNQLMYYVDYGVEMTNSEPHFNFYMVFDQPAETEYQKIFTYSNDIETMPIEEQFGYGLTFGISDKNLYNQCFYPLANFDAPTHLIRNYFYVNDLYYEDIVSQINAPELNPQLIRDAQVDYDVTYSNYVCIEFSVPIPDLDFLGPDFGNYAKISRYRIIIKDSYYFVCPLYFPKSKKIKIIKCLRTMTYPFIEVIEETINTSDIDFIPIFLDSTHKPSNSPYEGRDFVFFDNDGNEKTTFTPSEFPYIHSSNNEFYVASPNDFAASSSAENYLRVQYGPIYVFMDEYWGVEYDLMSGEAYDLCLDYWFYSGSS